MGDSFKMYVCGITPYDATHLGHAATYLSFDLINRYKRLSGSKVSFVENITDIDDPLFERANRDKIDWQASYLNPYNDSQTYYNWLKDKNIKTVDPNNYHFGADAHQMWADHLTKIINESIITK